MKFFLDPNQNKIEKPADTEVLWRPSAYPIVQSADKKILMVVPTWGTRWELPGGGINIGETIPEGIARECYEETGYKIEVTEKIPIHFAEQDFFCDNVFYHTIIFVFPAKLVSKIQDKHIINTVEINEISKIEWVPLTELTEENCQTIIWPAIRKLKESL